MTLANLKKRGPSVKRAPVSVEQFIDDALRYANGCHNVVALPVAETNQTQPSGQLRRATFTLGDKAIQHLENLSQQTGIAKSRLIRIWLDELQHDTNLQPYLMSNTK